MITSWDKKFMEEAVFLSARSKDPERKVGCVITDEDNNRVVGCYNGFPRGIKDDHRLYDVATKLRLIVHAEANAVAAAARNRGGLRGCTAYVNRPPCSQCMALLLQSGIVRLVYTPFDEPSKWEEDWVLAQIMMNECGIQYEALTL